MGSLTSVLDYDDLAILLDATNEWEALGNHDYHVLNTIKLMPLPAEGQETHDLVKYLKESFQTKERDIKAARELRQEKAIFLKAKLMLIKRDLSIDQLFDDAYKNNFESKFQKGLQQAEAFIESMGCSDYYRKYLDEHKVQS